MNGFSSSPDTAQHCVEPANSTIARRYVSYADAERTTDSWISAKQRDDRLGPGLWRIHNELYDLRPFAALHPGGQFWISATEGTDITEAYETHHLYTDRLASSLALYRVAAAAEKRSVRFTFADGGFYCTLKRRVAEHLERTNYRERLTATHGIADALLAATIALSILATCIPFGFLPAAIALTALTNAAHNYLHQADNVRMYYFNLSGLSCWEWRVSHAISHHLFTNSLLDMETLMLAPLLTWLPAAARRKAAVLRFAQWLYGPFVYAAFFAITVVSRLLHRLRGGQRLVQGADWLLLALPAAMCAVNPAAMSWAGVARVWLQIWTTSSFMFGVMGLNVGHRYPLSVADGDEVVDEIDWGVYQLDALVDRDDLRGSHFWAVTQFGDHHLHHLFPALDHGCLAELYPLLERTAAEFGVRVRTAAWPKLIVGQHWQMVRREATTQRERMRSG